LISKKSNNIPNEKDTRILYQKQSKLGRYDFHYEIWSWDGYRAESLIFFPNDGVAALTDQEIEKLVLASGLIKGGL
jgi:hypothetical protein